MGFMNRANVLSRQHHAQVVHGQRLGAPLNGGPAVPALQTAHWMGGVTPQLGECASLGTVRAVMLLGWLVASSEAHS